MIATRTNIIELQNRFYGVYHKNLGDKPSVVVYCPQCNAQYLDIIVLNRLDREHKPDDYAPTCQDCNIELHVGVSCTHFITTPEEITK